MGGYFVFDAADVGGEDVLLEAALVDHDFEVDVDVLAAGHVVGLLLLLLPLHVLHLHPPLLPLLLDALDLVQRVRFLLLAAALHLYNLNNYPLCSNANRVPNRKFILNPCGTDKI